MNNLKFLDDIRYKLKEVQHAESLMREQIAEFIVMFHENNDSLFEIVDRRIDDMIIDSENLTETLNEIDMELYDINKMIYKKL